MRETYWKSSVIHARGNGYRDKEGMVMEMVDGAVVVKIAMDRRLEKILRERQMHTINANRYDSHNCCKGVIILIAFTES